MRALSGSTVPAARHAAAHASSAAVHAGGHFRSLFAVDSHGAAVDFTGLVIIERARRCRNIQRPVIDIDAAVRVNGICVALSHCDRSAAAVKRDDNAAGRALCSCVDAVIRCGYRNVPAVDLDIGSFDAFRCSDIQTAAVDLGDRGSLYAVIVRLDPEGASGDQDRTDSLVVRILAVNTVFAAVDREGSVRYADGVMRPDSVLRTGDVIRPARDDDIIIGLDAVALCGPDGERTLPVQCEVGPGVNGSILVRLLIHSELSRYRQGIAAALCGGDEDLVRVCNADGRFVFIRNRKTVQHKLYLRIRCIYFNRHI